MMATVKVIRSHMASGIARHVGDVYETEDHIAVMLVGANKAKYTAPPKPKRGSMTTKSSAGLIGKGEENA